MPAYSSVAVPPAPGAVRKWIDDGVWTRKVANLREFKLAGGNAPSKHPVFRPDRQAMALSTGNADTAHVIVILVDFVDKPYNDGAMGTPAAFDSILFSDRRVDSICNRTGSMTDYFLENSYGRFFVEGDILGWLRMPRTYEWYEGGDDGLSRGRELARDAARAAEDAGADFSRYDRNNDGRCDGLIIVHAGRGAQEYGVVGIWSHKSTIWPAEYFDGVEVSEYTMNPEEYRTSLSPIGVFCHEYGHMLGLPDLYDIDYTPESSDGLGKWSLMASGNYNGGCRLPAHLDAWSKVQVGFLQLVDVTDNRFGTQIPAVEYNPVAYRLRDRRNAPNEYWIVENRQKAGFDRGLPGDGLCIYHVDPLAPAGNTDYRRYRVALEQADGADQLAMSEGNRGDVGDPWPGFTNNRHFTAVSSPNTNANDGVGTEIGVWNISDSDSLMYADLDVTFSRPWISLCGSMAFRMDDAPPNGNGDGHLNAGETISCWGSVKNVMRIGYNTRFRLSIPDRNFEITHDEAPLYCELDANCRTNGTPITFVLPDTLEPSIDSVFLTVTCDSLPGVAGGGAYSATFGFEVTIGTPTVLLIDDDRGADYETAYLAALHELRRPADVWCVEELGVPAASDLDRYPVVIWFTGDSAEDALDRARISAMRSCPEFGNNLLLSTISGVTDIKTLDASFLSDFFGARWSGMARLPLIEGAGDNPVGRGTSYFYRQNVLFTDQTTLSPVLDGHPAFTVDGETCGMTHVGDGWRTVLLAFPLEYIDDRRCDSKATLLSRVLAFFGDVHTSVYDGQPFAGLPESFHLHQNYPNPFNPTTTISYAIKDEGPGDAARHTELVVYNVLGRRVKTLVNGRQAPGTYEVSWDGTNEAGRQVATGVYFYRLARGDQVQSRKMLLLR